ncbi:MAG: hypothetical protein EZS28_050966 [Streblomastix strix]|uniref:Tyr recombinase domain-containing protein n=1 Tax=Streblomastix strix TaxID=222440 RepID=A0A5J4T5K5_9EUKA|nr:MAG: hypothetical protein EZS28_050966 [Streblomastix strix]
MRPTEIEGISLICSVICKQTDKVDQRLQPKTKSGLHSHKLPKSRDRIVCPRATFFDCLKRIDNKYGLFIRVNKYGALRWNEDITVPAKRGQISLRLKKLLDVMGIKGEHVYSFRHSAATQLVVIGLDEAILNTYTGHARNSKSTNDHGGCLLLRVQLVQELRLRFKRIDKRNRAARLQFQVQISKTNNLSSSLRHSSQGSPFRKPKLKQGQSQIFKDPSSLDAKNQRKQQSSKR